MARTDLKSRISEVVSGAVASVTVASDELSEAIQLMINLAGGRVYSSRAPDGNWILSRHRPA